MGNNIPKTVICKCLNLLDIGDFRSIFMDHRTRKLTTGKAIQIFVESQLAQRSSYEEIAEHLRITPELQDENLKSISASQLSRKLKKLPTSLLQKLFLFNVSRIQEKTKGKKGIPELGTLRIIDATVLSLPSIAGRWAYWSKEKNAVKMHTQLVVAEPKTVYPGKIIASTAAVNDHEVAMDLVVADDAIHVVDRGYISYSMYHQWIQNNVLFVARIQAKNKTEIIRQRPIPEGSHLTLDADVWVRYKEAQGQTQEIELRLVEYLDEKGRPYRLLTNVWDRTAEQISEIYRHRWLIELFFKWMKQHLRLVKLYSADATAIWNQMYIALIAYSLLLLLKLELQTNHSLWELLRFVVLYMDQPWDVFMAALFRKAERPSKGRRRKGHPGRPRKHPPKLTSVRIIVE
mgnify:CR=1 FL=1|jgi:hypothetical protein